MTRRILVVDDSATSRHALRTIVQSGGYEVVTASGAAEGIAIARTGRPDLVLMDVVMPGMDGFTACRALRDDPVTTHVPIILVTTEQSEDSFETGFQSGCSDYVLKPIDETELLVKIESCLSAAPPWPDPGPDRRGRR